MNVLVLNGSPRGQKGMTWWLLERFIKGMEEAGATVNTIQLATKKIHHCAGCFSCWVKTPGRCIQDDDMETIASSVQASDALVLATPIYVDGMTGLLKNCVDRLLPLADPHFEIREGHARHPLASNHPKRVALLSPCGFPEMDNFKPLVEHVKAFCKNMDARYAGAVLRPGAPILPYATIRHPFKTRTISRAVHQAGIEFAAGGMITEDTSEKVAAEITSRENYLKDANRHFEKMISKGK